MYEIFAKLLKEKGLKAADVTRATGIKSPVFSEWKKGKSKPNTEKMIKIANFLGVSVEYLTTGKELENDKKYYLNSETAQVAQEIFENKELRALFDVQKDMQPEDLRALHNMALALKRKERGDIDDTGC